MPAPARMESRGGRPLRRVAVTLAISLCGPLAARAQLTSSGAQYWFGGTPGLGTLLESNGRFAAALAIGDFDGDGFSELAVGVPGLTVTGHSTAGAVLVLHGAEAGPVVAGNQVWTQDDFGTNPVENFDFFGTRLAAGDFDGDGFDDLAVGAPNEAIGSFEGAGSVSILYGGAGGLVAAGAQVWNQESPGVPDLSEPADSFGGELAVGDFDVDGFDDLAIGIHGEDQEGSPTYLGLGAVQLLFGSAAGLAADGTGFYRPGDAAVDLPPMSSAGFGVALAACRFAPGEPPVLVVGVPGQPVASATLAGVVVALDELGGAAQTLFVVSQDTPGVPGGAETNDRFGWELACGDFDRDGADEVAVGVPFEAIGTNADAGAVNILETGASPVHTLWYEDLLEGSVSSPDERFGWALVAADLDADGAAELVIGTPGEPVAAQDGAGAVFALYGTAGSGLGADGHQMFGQAVDAPEVGDGHGGVLAAGRLCGHSGADLAIGAPFEDLLLIDSTGAADVLFSIALFRDGFASGDTTAWSSTTP